MRKIILLALCFLCIFNQSVFSINEESIDEDMTATESADRTAYDAVKGAFFGVSEALFCNTLIMVNNIVFNSLTGMATWAKPSSEALRKNLTRSWEWEDTDGYLVNFFGHPYQGSTYFSAGRVNGFTFYESVLLSAFGSSSWETFFESNHASINDAIITTVGSMSVGEIIYRLFLEARAADLPGFVGLLINPLAAFHYWLGRQTPPSHGRNLYQLEFRFAPGFAQTEYTVSGMDEKLYSFLGLYGNVSITAVYGNPFEQDSRVPFNHFEMFFNFGLDFFKYNSMRFISDGYLFSFSPVYTKTDTLSSGLTLNLDFVSLGASGNQDSTLDQFSNALDWTVKYQHIFPRNTIIRAKAHAGFTFMGASKYYSPPRKRDLKNYGYGFNAKLFFNLENEKFGRLETGIYGYMLLPYPGTSKLSASSKTYWFYSEATYSHYIGRHLSLGVTDLFGIERGFYGEFPDTSKFNNEVKIFLAWNM